MEETTELQAETTAEASQAENETDQTTQEDQTTETQEDSDSQPKTVPYERLQEVIKSRKDLESKISDLEGRLERLQSDDTRDTNPQENQVKQQLDKYLKELGYVSRQELEQKEADKQLEGTLKSLSSKYNGKDGRPKFDKTKVLRYAADHMIGDLEVAYESMHNAELIDWHVKQALGKTKGIKSETSDGSGSSQVGTSQDDLKEAAARGDSSAIQALLKRAL